MRPIGPVSTTAALSGLKDSLKEFFQTDEQLKLRSDLEKHFDEQTFKPLLTTTWEKITEILESQREQIHLSIEWLTHALGVPIEKDSQEIAFNSFCVRFFLAGLSHLAAELYCGTLETTNSAKATQIAVATLSPLFDIPQDLRELARQRSNPPETLTKSPTELIAQAFTKALEAVTSKAAAAAQAETERAAVEETEKPADPKPLTRREKRSEARNAEREIKSDRRAFARRAGEPGQAFSEDVAKEASAEPAPAKLLGMTKKQAEDVAMDILDDISEENVIGVLQSMMEHVVQDQLRGKNFNRERQEMIDEMRVVQGDQYGLLWRHLREEKSYESLPRAHRPIAIDAIILGDRINFLQSKISDSLVYFLTIAEKKSKPIDVRAFKDCLAEILEDQLDLKPDSVQLRRFELLGRNTEIWPYCESPAPAQIIADRIFTQAQAAIAKKACASDDAATSQAGSAVPAPHPKPISESPVKSRTR